MLSDIDIAQAAHMKPIIDIASDLGIEPDYVEPYGKYKAKISLKCFQDLETKKSGKLILVTAINPTPAGEGKTTTTVGLGQALNRLGKKAIIALREPSLGPSFGIKGGAAGGGYSQVVPMDDINLHFTGDIHAVSTAHNLLAALIDNHIHHGNALEIDNHQINWRRVIDLNDRALRSVIVALGGKLNGFPRETGFDISVASEVMAALCLSNSLSDLKDRFKKIVVAYDRQGNEITAEHLNAAGSMALLMKDAIKPNLVQTLENTPAFIHGGPFANIAHGANSILATRLGLKLADYLVTEAGFGADLGAEKFFDIVCRYGNFRPSAVVLVATVRALKNHAGLKGEQLSIPNVEKLAEGFANLEKHLQNLQKYGVPVVVAINEFPSDSKEELEFLQSRCQDLNAEMAISRVWADGGKGGEELARKVMAAADCPADFKYLYPLEMGLVEKIKTICMQIYGAAKVEFSDNALKMLKKFEEQGHRELPVCIAKTQYSLSDDQSKIGVPSGFTINIREVRLSAGAGFVVALAGNIMTLPGLGKVPSAEKIDIMDDGTILGLF